MVHVRNFESHILIMDWCALVNVASGVENSVLQALYSQDVSIPCILPGATGINHC
jgi:hypothetical protein